MSLLEQFSFHANFRDGAVHISQNKTFLFFQHWRRPKSQGSFFGRYVVWINGRSEGLGGPSIIAAGYALFISNKETLHSR